MDDFLKSKIPLIAASRISSAIMRDVLGFGPRPGTFTTASNNTPETLTIEKLEEIVKLLHSDEVEAQKDLIRLLASVGFDVKLMDGFDRSMVFLPTKYKQAMSEIRTEQDNETT